MSFSTLMKDDLARVVSSKSCCRRAEFLAFFLINGNIRIGKGVSLVMNTEHSGAARKMYTLAGDFGLEREVSAFRRSRLKKNNVYSLEIPAQEQMKSFLAELGMVDEQISWRFDFTDAVRERFLRQTCCRRAYLRGAFLAAGSVTDPETGSYHLEIDSLDDSQAELIIELLSDFELKGKTVSRRETKTVYLKGADQISTFMNVIGAHRALLQLESLRVTREVRNRTNRWRNCDNANMNKSVEAGLRQTADIKYIIEQIGFETLPQNLRAAAELRLDNTEATLSELAEMSGLGRSALNHRLRRLTEIANNIRVYGPEEWDRD